MSLLLALLAQALHVGLMLLAAPLLAGVESWLTGRLAGLRGTPPWQPMHEMARLWRKSPISQDNLTAVSAIAPAGELGLALAAAALVPSFATGMALSPLADLLVIAGLLAAGRLVPALAAFDLGTAPAGVRAQDAARLGVPAEAALILVVVALGLMAGGFGTDQVVTQQQDGLMQPAAALVVALAAMLALALAEASQPDPHELLFNGPDLAIALLAGWLRRLVWIDLISALFLPFGMSTVAAGPLGWLLGVLAWAAKLFFFLSGFAAVQTALGRIPRHSLPDLLGVAALLGLLAAIIVLASTSAV